MGRQGDPLLVQYQGVAHLTSQAQAAPLASNAHLLRAAMALCPVAAVAPGWA